MMVVGLIGYFIGLWFSDLPWLAFICIGFLVVWTTIKKAHPTTLLILMMFLVGVLYSSMKDTTTDWVDQWFVVTSRSEQAIIVWRLGNFYRIESPHHEFYVGDVLSISGQRLSILMNHYESRFDYGQYLFNQGVRSAIEPMKIHRLWRYPFSSLHLLGDWATHLPKIPVDILTLFIWNQNISNNTLNMISENIGLSLYFSQTGMLLFFVEQSIQKCVIGFTKKNYQQKVTIIFYILIGLVNPFSLTILRRLSRSIVYHLSSRKSVRSWSINLIIFAIFTLFSRYIVFNWSFLVVFVIQLFSWLNLLLKPYVHAILSPMILPFFISFFFGILQSFSAGIFLPFNTFIMLTFLPWLLVLIILSFINVILPASLPLTLTVLNGFSVWGQFIHPFNVGFYYGTHLWFWIVIGLMILLFIYGLQQQFHSLIKVMKWVLPSLLVFQLFPYESFIMTQISFINVGQGDAMLLYHRHQAWLIDTGGQLYFDLAKESLIPFLRKQKIVELEGVIITHQDFDHMGALDSLQNHVKVKQVITDPLSFPMVIGTIEIHNLNPITNHPDENTNSLVLYLNIQHTSFLLMGDAGIENEEAIMNRFSPFRVHILKVGHHGSNTSTSASFLDFIQPEVAIISAARLNRYGHPHQEVVRRLMDRKIHMRSTMDEGTISYKFYGSV